MVARGTPLPLRIEPDGIREAIFEIRFDASSLLPEMLLGRLAGIPAWRGFKQRRLPAYEIPATIRDADPNLRYQPVFELVGTNPSQSVRIGAHVLSYHFYAPYPGWAEFACGLDTAVDGLIGNTENDLVVNRLGMRYINVLTEELHGVGLVSDLDVGITVSESPLTGRLNLTFTEDAGRNTEFTVRIATQEFVQGVAIPAVAVVVDIDVSTEPNLLAPSPADLKKWAEYARTVKNQAFLCLLTDDTLKRLRRD